MTPSALCVKLYGEPVAHLQRHAVGWHLTFERRYVEAVPRPVLGQTFEDRDLRKARRDPNLFPFFRNLLPEGALRALIVQSTGIADDDATLLARLGSDLPGAVTLEVADERPADVGRASDWAGTDRRDQPVDDSPFRFSLAGVQPKLSADVSPDSKRITLPASGEGARWIVKLPTPHYPGLSRIEHSVMTWARESGFEVPEIRLIPPEALAMAPKAFRAEVGQAFACRRYDRSDDASRLHQEDFAQVFDVEPEHKYGRARSIDAVRLAQVVKRVLGPEGHTLFLRRLVFDLACGNGDAHLKNWSLLYSEPTRPRLAPCYDLVATILFIRDDAPGLPYPGRPGFHDIDRACFRKLLRQTGDDTEATWAMLGEQAVRQRDTWHSVRETLELTLGEAEQIEAHMDRVPLLRDLCGRIG